jgi:hypothetical protein
MLRNDQGSVVWVINGFFVWLPLQDPWTEFDGEVASAGGITAFIGATIFEIGSVFLMLEAVNENRSDCFGWALEEAVETGLLSLEPKHEGCHHSHSNKGAFLSGNTIIEADAAENSQRKEARDPRKWAWWPTWYELRTHYFRDVGFLACFFQMLGATIFWIAGFTGLEPIQDVLKDYTPALNGIYWLPQVSLLFPECHLPSRSPGRHDGRRLRCGIGRWRKWLHHLEHLVHVGDATKVVYTEHRGSRVAYWILELDRGHWLHSVRSSRLWD